MTRDELEQVLRIITLQDFLAAFLWLAKNEEGKIPQRDGKVLRFLRDHCHCGMPGAPERIKRKFDHVWFYEEIGGVYSRELDPILSRMAGNHFFEHPVSDRAWRTVCKGEKELELFTPEEQKYLTHLAADFRRQFSS